MTEPINLNKARKAKAKDVAKATAARNRVRFGEAKAARGLRDALSDKADRVLDGKKREP